MWTLQQDCLIRFVVVSNSSIRVYLSGVRFYVVYFIMSCGIFIAPLLKDCLESPSAFACYTRLWSLLSVVSSDNEFDAVILWAVCCLCGGEFT